MIWFNGKSSDDMNVIVQRYPVHQIPMRKVEKLTIPGRSGDVIFPEDAFENYEQQYEIYVSAKREGLRNAARNIVEWLMFPGYARLEDSYDKEFFRMANFIGPVEIESFFDEYGTATLTFDCMPQRWFKYGEYAVTMTEDTKLLNPSRFDAKPLIKVTGTGDGTITVGNTEIELTDIDGFIFIDCEAMNCYKGNINCNSKVSGKFPALGKETQVTWDGDVEAVEITPRWYTV